MIGQQSRGETAVGDYTEVQEFAAARAAAVVALGADAPRHALTVWGEGYTAARSLLDADHVEAVAYADDIDEGKDVPDNYERHYCEADGEEWPCAYARHDAENERDSARAKLDTVRALADEPSPDNDWRWGYDAAMADVLAILDGKDTK